MNCINCNESIPDFKHHSKCPLCCAEHQDWYYSADHTILIIELILCKVQAYRHILINRFHQQSTSTKIYSYFTLFLLYVLLELFYKYQNNILKYREQKELEFAEILSSTKHIILVLAIQMSTIYLCTIVICQRVKHTQLIAGLILSHFGRLATIMFVIWNHSHFFKQMASLSILLSELTTIRSICEERGNWIKSTIVLCCALIIQKIISEYLGIYNITIL